MYLPIMGKDQICTIETDAFPEIEGNSATMEYICQVPVVFDFDLKTESPVFNLFPGYHVRCPGLRKIEIMKSGCFALLTYRIHTDAENHEDLISKHLEKINNYQQPHIRKGGIYVKYIKEEDMYAGVYFEPEPPGDYQCKKIKTYYDDQYFKIPEVKKMRRTWLRQYKKSLKCPQDGWWRKDVIRKSKKYGYLFEPAEINETLSSEFVPWYRGFVLRDIARAQARLF